MPAANHCTIADTYYDADEQPYAGAVIQAYWVNSPVLRAAGGVLANKHRTITADASGAWSADFLWASASYPTTTEIMLAFPRGERIAGMVPSLSGPLTLTELVAAPYNWAPVNPSQSVTVVQGPAGMVWRDAWSSSTTYQVNDVVYSGAQSWIALAQNTNSQPSGANANWAKVNDPAATGTPTTQGVVLLSQYNPRDYGAVINETTNDATAVNTAGTAAVGSTVYLPKGTYGLGAALDPANKAIHYRGEPGTVFKRLPANNVNLLGGVSAGDYAGSVFESIEFDGNARGGGATVDSFKFSGMTDVVFRDCVFRDRFFSAFSSGMKRIRFERCRFYGTAPGVMPYTSGYVPTDTLSARYGRGASPGIGFEDVSFHACLFHFCYTGVETQGGTNTPSAGLRFTDCTFRGDWWCNPYIQKTLSPTSFDVVSFTLTAPSGTGFNSSTFNPAFGTPGLQVLQPVTFRRELGTDTVASTLNNTLTLTSGVTGMQKGDVVETADGKRAEISGIASTTSVTVLGWEDCTTYEPTTAPAALTALRVSRFYGSTVITPLGTLSDTQVQLSFEPTCVFTGERLFTDAGISASSIPGTVECRILAPLAYSGIHLGAGSGNLTSFLVEGSRFRGSCYDSLVCGGAHGSRFIGNHFEYTQDMAFDFQNANNCVAIGNTCRQIGTGISINGNGHVLVANTLDGWATTQRSIQGGLQLNNANDTSVTSMTFARSAPSVSGCSYAIGLTGSCQRTTISGVRDGGAAQIATVRFDGATIFTTELRGDPVSIAYTRGATSAALTGTSITVFGNTNNRPTAANVPGKMAIAPGTLVASPTAPTAALATGGSLAIGTAVTYGVTFSTLAGGQTLVGDASTPLTPDSGNRTVTLTSIPTGTGDVTYRGIYRSDDGGTTWTQVGHLHDNTTTTFTDAGQSVSTAPNQNPAVTAPANATAIATGALSYSDGSVWQTVAGVALANTWSQPQTFQSSVSVSGFTNNGGFTSSSVGTAQFGGPALLGTAQTAGLSLGTITGGPTATNGPIIQPQLGANATGTISSQPDSTTLVLGAGDGAHFAINQRATVGTGGTAETITITVVSTDTLTVTPALVNSHTGESITGLDAELLVRALGAGKLLLNYNATGSVDLYNGTNKIAAVDSAGLKANTLLPLTGTGINLNGVTVDSVTGATFPNLLFSGILRSTNTGTPTITPQAGAGSTASASLVAGNDVRGTVLWTPGGSGIAAGNQVFVAFSATYPSIPLVIGCWGGGNTLGGLYIPQATITTSGFYIATSLPVSGTQYRVTYLVIA